MITKWDLRWLKVAEQIASWSKHPDVKVGCVIVDHMNIQLSGGYNGLPRGLDDSRIHMQDKSVSSTAHAEANAVAAAARKGHALDGGTCYITRPACAQCAALLIQAGIKRVVILNVHPGNKWVESCNIAAQNLAEVGVEYVFYCNG